MRILLFINLILFLTGCSSSENDKNENKLETSDSTISNEHETKNHNEDSENKVELKNMNEDFIYSEDSVLIPSFEVFVDLDEKANKKLEESNETIIVKAFFRGEPKDTLNEDYQEWAHMPIGQYEIELKNTRVARFDNIKISRPLFEELIDENFEVLINVYSGRKSGMYNLLDCKILQKPINEIKGKRNTLTGKLI